MQDKQEMAAERERRDRRDASERRMRDTLYPIKVQLLAPHHVVTVKDVIERLNSLVVREHRESVADDGEWRVTLVVSRKLLDKESDTIKTFAWESAMELIEYLGSALRVAGMNNRYDKLNFVVLNEDRGDILLHVKWPIP